MKKLIVLLIAVILALASMTGYLYLTEQITAGQLKIAAGQKQLAEGEQMLANGKTKLRNGKQKLAVANGVYKGIQSVPLMGIADKLPVSGQILQAAGGKIAEGNKMAAAGSEKIKAGETQLADGKEELQQGIERLSETNNIRIACAVGTVIFSALLLALGFFWRRSLAVLFIRKQS